LILAPGLLVKFYPITDSQKKTVKNEKFRPRLLEKEEIGVLNSRFKPRQIVISRHSIEHDVTAILRKGLTTTSAGGFFFIPYLLQLDVHNLLEKTGKPKLSGIPKERLGLGVIFESLFGYTAGVRSIDAVSMADFGLLAGLPFIPSPTTQYRFHQSFSFEDGLCLQVDLGKKLRELGQIKASSSPINVDAHNIKTYSRKEMKKSYITQEKNYGKAIRTFYTQDQYSNKPIMAIATYSGTSVRQITENLVKRTKKILQRDFIMVADKEWYCGQLIDDLHKKFGVSILVPAKRSKKRLQEFDAVPIEKYNDSICGKIAAVYTTMKEFSGPLLLLLKKRPDGKYFALITPNKRLTGNDAFPIYSKRWDIELFFGENSFLGINHLPSLNLNAIQMVLSLRLLAFQVFDNFRNDLGYPYNRQTAEIIHREFIDGVQGRIQLKGDTIIVKIYGFEHARAVAAIFSNLENKLQAANVDPRIPWLGNRKLKFEFY
jgi:hypothetical protein